MGDLTFYQKHLHCAGTVAPRLWYRQQGIRKTCRFYRNIHWKPGYASEDETKTNCRMSVWRQPHREPPLGPARRLCKRLSVPSIHNGIIRKAVCGHKENTAAEYSGCSTPHAGGEQPLPPPVKAIHRSTIVAIRHYGVVCNSTISFLWQDGRKWRLLHEWLNKYSWPQSSHRSLAKPFFKTP